MRIALSRPEPTVGDPSGNAGRMLDSALAAVRGGAGLVAFPELAICGYPPRDLLQREGFVEACGRALGELAAGLASAGAGDALVVAGCPVRSPGGRLLNAACALRGGRVEATHAKRLLPQYDVFDEPRHFDAGSSATVVPCGPRRVGLLACEDLWRARDVPGAARYEVDPAAECVAAGADLLLAVSASPFAVGKAARQRDAVAETARRLGVPVLSVNAFGANDDLVFDGLAAAAWPDGTVRAGGRWGDCPFTVDLASRTADGDAGPGGPAACADEERWDAIVAGIRSYVRKTGHRSVALGLSGGIDSALVGALAAAALGGDRVTGLLMPGAHSSAGSLSDAHELARRCGIRAIEVPISGAHSMLSAHLASAFAGAGASMEGLADENLQSRLRGIQLMAWSNASGALVLTTGNRSEYAVGYATLYGDMCGALAPIGDVLKTDVWSMARWANANHARAGFARPPVPEASISKVPSAELRPDQSDQDTLPPYEELDAIVREWVGHERSVDDVAARTGLGRDAVARWTRAIDLAEFKRAQAPVILRMGERAFGRGRRMPIVARPGGAG
jgi:NAD+ synthase (glutamine-hydrolysing)